MSLKVSDKHYEKNTFYYDAASLSPAATAAVNIVTLQAELGYVTTVRITSHNNGVYTVNMSKISSRMFFSV